MDAVELIRKEFIERKHKNPRYSLRAFSKFTRRSDLRNELPHCRNWAD